jgi:hypothetical protein
LVTTLWRDCGALVISATPRAGCAARGSPRLARGEDDRTVDAHAPAHSISAENTLGHDEADADVLAHAF